jgi:hypothetical protein
VTAHTFRITVRGFFNALTQAQRSELLAEADERDISGQPTRSKGI